APISGTFTIESQIAGLAASTNLNGQVMEVGSFYPNAVSQLSLNIREQHFDFARTRPPGSLGANESYVSVIDLPMPSNDPTTNYDSYNFNVRLGDGIFEDPFNALTVSFTMVRSEHYLNAIHSRDMVDNLVYSTNWSTFFSIFDQASGRSYQIYAP